MDKPEIKILEFEPKRILTFDVEEWYHANYDGFDYRTIEKAEKRLDYLIPEILGLLEETSNRATFFVLGEIASLSPHLVREIHKAGFPIASHSMTHRLLKKLSDKQIENELCESKDLLEGIIGQEIVGYRAPCFGIGRKQYPLLMNLLSKFEYKYDSSIVPLRYIGGGFSDLPSYPFVFNGLIEFPIAAWGLGGYGFALSGGHFRFLPLSIINRFSEILENQKKTVVYYLHPKDLDDNNPSLPMPFHYNLIHQFGTKGSKKKLEKMLRLHKFYAIEDFLSIDERQNKTLKQWIEYDKKH